VVDQASSDGSSQVDEEFPSVTVLRLPRNFGRSRARNIAVRSAATGLILLLSPFVEVEPGSVGQVIDFMEANPDCAAAALRLESAPPDQLVLPSPQELTGWCRLGLEAEDVRALLVRKGFLQGMNYFDEKRFSQAGAELELFWQLRNAGKSIPVLESARAKAHSPKFSISLDAQAADLVYCDRVAGASAWISKHFGLVSGLSFRLGRAVANLASPRRAYGILAGARIDGTQAGILG
jgi:GT2 family glycosyltransferase